MKQTQCEEKAADQQLQRQVRQEVLKLRRQTGATYREGTEQQHTCKWRSHNLGVLLCLAHLEKTIRKNIRKVVCFGQGAASLVFGVRCLPVGGVCFLNVMQETSCRFPHCKKKSNDIVSLKTFQTKDEQRKQRNSQRCPGVSGDMHQPNLSSLPSDLSWTTCGERWRTQSCPSHLSCPRVYAMRPCRRRVVVRASVRAKSGQL